VPVRPRPGTRPSSPLTAEQLEQMVLTEVDKIQSLHTIAAQIEAKKNVDLVAEVVAKRVLE
jgi:hypothetical protein